MKLINRLNEYLEDNNYQIIIKEKSINIINFQEILDFSEKNIKIRCINKIIEIDGQKMIVSKMLDDEILITGIINNIRIK